MRSNSPSLAFITFTLSLYAAALTASTAHAEPLPAGTGRQISDQNLFEVHLQRPASSQKRLPSEILKDLRERDEVAEVQSMDEPIITSAPVASTSATGSAATTFPSAIPASSSSPSSSYSAAAIEITYTPRQPSHFIRHRSNKGGKAHGKRRLDSFSSEPATVTIARDSDELSSLWEIPEIIARAANAYGSTTAAIDSSAETDEQQTNPESSLYSSPEEPQH